MDNFDYYEILEITKNADKSTIKKAYRKMAMKYHPDKNPNDKNAEDSFKKVNEAYQVLSNDEKKSIYDRYGKEGLEGRGNSRGGGFSGFGGGGFEDIFESFFSDGFGSSRSQQGRKRDSDKYSLDLGIDVEVEFNEAIFGVTKDITYNYKVSCKSCKGTGAKDAKKTSCKTCDGNGVVIMQQGPIRFQQTCPHCEGTGEMIAQKCNKCSGDGSEIENDTIEINIPQGVDNGNRIRVSGRGNISKSGKRGDLYITISVKDDEHFIRSENDIYVEVAVHFTQVALGDTFTIQSPRGELELKIPIGTRDKEKFLFRNKGVKDVHSQRMGHFYAQIKIIYPTALNKVQRDLLEKLQDSFGIESNPHQEVSDSIAKRIKSWFS